MITQKTPWTPAAALARIMGRGLNEWIGWQ